MEKALDSPSMGTLSSILISRLDEGEKRRFALNENLEDRLARP